MEGSRGMMLGGGKVNEEKDEWWMQGHQVGKKKGGCRRTSTASLGQTRAKSFGFQD